MFDKIITFFSFFTKLFVFDKIIHLFAQIPRLLDEIIRVCD